MKVNSIKNIKPTNHFYKKLASIILSVFIAVLCYAFLDKTSKKAEETIDVIRVKAEDGIMARTVITKNNVEKYSLIKKEYDPEMITYDQIDDIINKYTLYYLRKDTILYNDMIIDEIPKRNEWLYDLEYDMEVVTIPYNSLECGGDILMPGDLIRVRAIREKKQSDQGDIEDEIPNYLDFDDFNEDMEVITVFDSIRVKDLLNSKGSSIYEVYKEVFKLSNDKRQKIMKTDEFLQSIKPRAVVLEATAEQVDLYSKLKLEAREFVFTILSRKGNMDLIDQLPTLEKEIESWLKEE
ncbi:CpaB family protein [Defluviitalea phaphyphila]|uniref:hypothetical protein n=1 Tax=Defluviitalea phaphyphila TaxID=1473580 RepID=UPI00072FC553|nr:hypothetical protein [Defluviitalea phaphyphila]